MKKKIENPKKPTPLRRRTRSLLTRLADPDAVRQRDWSVAALCPRHYVEPFRPALLSACKPVAAANNKPRSIPCRAMPDLRGCRLATVYAAGLPGCRAPSSLSVGGIRS